MLYFPEEEDGLELIPPGMGLLAGKFNPFNGRTYTSLAVLHHDPLPFPMMLLLGNWKDATATPPPRITATEGTLEEEEEELDVVVVLLDVLS